MAFCIVKAHLFRKGDPIIKLLLLVSLWINAETLQMYQETLWITTNEYLLRSNLARQTSLTHQFIVLVKQLLYTKTFNAVDERSVLLDVEAEIEKVLFTARYCLTTYTCHYIQ